MFQRDAFIEEITKKLNQDKNIYFLSADLGAKALDDLRERFPNNFLHCGISEQAMLDVAAGLALEKNKVFVYAMSPFLSMRPLEQIKCGAGVMNLPICLISVGIGLGYADSNTYVEGTIMLLVGIAFPSISDTIILSIVILPVYSKSVLLSIREPSILKITIVPSL